MRAFLSTMFHLRYEVGGTVIFRTHWFILLQKIFLPTLILLGPVVIFVYSVLNQFALLSIQSTCGIIFLFGMIIFGWWFYQYLDWHNDVYLITPDQVVDVNKKPLGREERAGRADQEYPQHRIQTTGDHRAAAQFWHGLYPSRRPETHI